MDVGLAGKRAIITGAGGGIGRQTAQLFANAGAAVFINDIDADAIDAARADIPAVQMLNVIAIDNPTLCRFILLSFRCVASFNAKQGRY